MILLHLSISNQAHCERQQQVLIGADATVRVLCAPASRSTALPVLICAVDVDVASAQPAACDWLRLSLPRSRRFAASFLSQCVCMCVCARVCSWLWLCLCMCVCVSCLEFLLLLLLFPTVTLRGQRKYLGWLACISRSSLDEFTRLWLAWLATHTESKQTESESASASDSVTISATDFEYNSAILNPHPSSAPSACNLSRAVSLSLCLPRLRQCVCPCVYICLSVY